MASPSLLLFVRRPPASSRGHEGLAQYFLGRAPLSLLLAGALVALCPSGGDRGRPESLRQHKTGAPHRVPGRPRPPPGPAVSSALLPQRAAGPVASRGCRPLIWCRVDHACPRPHPRPPSASSSSSRAPMAASTRLCCAGGGATRRRAWAPAASHHHRSRLGSCRDARLSHPPRRRTVLGDWAASGIPRRYGSNIRRIGYAGEAGALTRLSNVACSALHAAPRHHPVPTAIRRRAFDCGQCGGRSVKCCSPRAPPDHLRLARRLATAKHPSDAAPLPLLDWRFLGQQPWQCVFSGTGAWPKRHRERDPPRHRQRPRLQPRRPPTPSSWEWTTQNDFRFSSQSSMAQITSCCCPSKRQRQRAAG